MIPRSQTLRYVAMAACIFTLVCCGCNRKTDFPTASPPSPAEAVSSDDDLESTSSPSNLLKLREDALAALDAGELDTASRLIRAARSAASNDPPTVVLMAMVLEEQHRYPEAIKMLDDLAESAPATRLAVLGQTARLMVISGEWRGAEERFRTMLDADPSAVAVRRSLADLLIRQGRRREAAAHRRLMCLHAEILEPELRSLLMLVHPFARDATADELDPVGPLGMARYEISQGNWDAAAKVLQQSSSNDPAEVALLGRIHAQRKDFDSLTKWSTETPEAAKQTADYWFAMGAHDAHREDHLSAVRNFCAAVLRDQTDAESYLLMSRSLTKLGAETESQATSKRAEQIRQTQALGNEMAESNDRDDQKLSTLIDLLDQLHRPLEALAWRERQISYGVMREEMSDAEARQALESIDRNRINRYESNQTEATQSFLLCGIDPDSLRKKRDANPVSDDND